LETISILVCLIPVESKRLIAKAVARHPLIIKALESGNILISSGTTTGYCVQEITGIPLEIERFPSGVVTDGVLCVTPQDRLRSVMIRKSVVAHSDTSIDDYGELKSNISELGPGDVYIKGANAIDSRGNAGYLLAHPEGGNILYALHRVYAQGIHFLAPTGLEKLVTSVPEAQCHMKGIKEYSYTFGRGCGYVSLTNSLIINELTAISQLTGAAAYHVASGGSGGSEGAVTLVVEGTAEQETTAVELLRSLKGEKSLPSWRMSCKDCTFRCKYRFGTKKPA